MTDRAAGRTTKVELVAEFLEHEPVATDLGPTLHPDDVAAGKMSALFSRAEVRDFIDVDALLRAGYTRDGLIALVERRDAGFDRKVLAEMLGGIGRFNDRQFSVYGPGIDVAGVRSQFADWQRELEGPAPGSSWGGGGPGQGELPPLPPSPPYRAPQAGPAGRRP
ncbi:nucleotidyl transferase AbiEii/AbiGii toxin family protein [Yinghuangia sp. ASG 101]|uniref:nucleotidyl transferase AbiEii/AbiGii toxin family protein n=1 Tax=Yinghuangia sp. ASG 101 TaxID=2896848 RepID=UPI001E54D20C|nr:nucleotidyl transferase AbiEii/AbiGii toxin family protein [Yinghuangia sp. ASG 101]UGQ09130.1 nucleotidyl transferase AbiEii/AbiGii toxin family protein [Yinghuangia sp. ASG 101]